MNLRQGVATPRDLLRELDESSVLIADELTPSLAAQVDWTKVRGFATDAGSRTYHTAILARSLDVPAVVGLHNASALVQAGQLVVIDGTGQRADPRSRRRGRWRAWRAARRRSPARRDAAMPSGGGRRRPPTACAIRLDANIEFPDDLAAARYAGAEGIGLYRSEFLLTGAIAASRRGRAVRDLPRHARRHGAGTGDRPHLRRRRGPARVARRAAAVAAAGSAERGARQPAGAARPASQPDPARAVPDAAARAAARGAPRLAADHVPVRLGRRAGARGAADDRRRGRRARRAAARRCRRCRSA